MAGDGEGVPTYTDLHDVYGTQGVAASKERYDTLKARFTQRFGAAPELFARSPGRVNLIGEHIDYEGYGVLPMAIFQDTIVAVRKTGDKLDIANVRTDGKYADVRFSTDPEQEVNVANHSWGNYLMCAYKGVYEHLTTAGKDPPPPAGLQLMVDGCVPTGAGLSSSAALVCASAIAILAAHGISLPKAELAEMACKCERHVGTESGGMDQAISVMGLPGDAMKIDFNPVRAAIVPLPEGAVFVIANSLTESNKAETAPRRYNYRVVECRLAAATLAVALGVTREKAAGIQTLQEIEGITPDGEDPLLERAAAAARKHLHDDAYTQEEVEGLLGMKLEDMFAERPACLRVLAEAAALGGFKLRQRAVHVFTEAERVLQFQAKCNEGGEAGAKLKELGGLMDSSHYSCRENYDCSCSELDELVGVSKMAGALGSRLTGAGWGGCTVSLVASDEADAFIADLKKNYFASRVERGVIAEDKLDEAVFSTVPARGGAILKL